MAQNRLPKPTRWLQAVAAGATLARAANPVTLLAGGCRMTPVKAESGTRALERGAAAVSTLLPQTIENN